jgi:hypothetical protein
MGVPTLDEELVPEDEIPNVNENDDSSLPDNEEDIAGNENTNKMPGFTSIMVILGLLLLLIIKCS